MMRNYPLIPLGLQTICTHFFSKYVLDSHHGPGTMLCSKDRVNQTSTLLSIMGPNVNTLSKHSLGFFNLVSLITYHTLSFSPLKLSLLFLSPMCFCSTFHIVTHVLASFYYVDYSKHSIVNSSRTGIISYSSFNPWFLATAYDE